VDLDPSSVPALVAVITAVLAGTAGEAGAHVWNSLVQLVRRTFGSGSAERDLVDQRPDAASIDILSRHLAARARTDPVFADALRSWASTAAPATGGDATVTNVVSGEAYIEGNVVQTRDVFGSITFGGTGHGP
jgi:hypothetical protein